MFDMPCHDVTQGSNLYTSKLHTSPKSSRYTSDTPSYYMVYIIPNDTSKSDVYIPKAAVYIVYIYASVGSEWCILIKKLMYSLMIH